MNEIATTQSTLEIIQHAPEALMLNESQVEKAVNSCTVTLKHIEETGMTDELDQRVNKMLVRLKEVMSEISDRRKPLTQTFDIIRKKFTELEAQIDPAKQDSVYAKLQVKRNQYAAWKMEEQRKREEAAARKLKADQERINIKAEIDIQLRNGFIKDLSTAKSFLQAQFDNASLESFEELTAKVREWNAVYASSEFAQIRINVSSIYMDKPDIELMIQKAKELRFPSFQIEYQKEITTLKQELHDKLPGLKRELEAIAEQKRKQDEAAKALAEAKSAEQKKAAEAAAKAAEEERLRMEKIAQDRREKEAEAAALAEEEERKKSIADAEAQKQLDMTNSLFDNQVEIAEANAQVNAVESWSIEVKNAPAWLLIVQFYFQNEGNKKSPAELEKKTLKQMKAFAEAFAKKHDERIDSPYIVYSPVYKVRAER